jgi:hypothetical protein
MATGVQGKGGAVSIVRLRLHLLKSECWWALAWEGVLVGDTVGPPVGVLLGTSLGALLGSTVGSCRDRGMPELICNCSYILHTERDVLL